MAQPLPGFVDTGITTTTTVGGTMAILNDLVPGNLGEIDEMQLVNHIFAFGGAPCGPGQFSGHYEWHIKTVGSLGTLPTAPDPPFNPEGEYVIVGDSFT